MKGIKCTSNEVNDILAGDKGQIRLVIKRQPCFDLVGGKISSGNQPIWDNGKELFVFGKCPHKVGDLVFVKESFFEDFENNRIFYDENFCQDTKTVTYLVEGEHGGVCEARIEKLKPAQHMKQHQSRITLRIKDISVERLQEISREDCLKEGKDQWEFICDWNATHKKPEEKWEANPFVWKIEFEVVK